ncbi:MAG: D-cysteine desulfhydrase family protein, partial [bacterium]
RKEGLYLDPVYTGKAFLGLMDLAKREIIPPGSRVLFLHTGGLGGLFQYEDMIGEMLP